MSEMKVLLRVPCENGLITKVAWSKPLSANVLSHRSLGRMVKVFIQMTFEMSSIIYQI